MSSIQKVSLVGAAGRLGTLVLEKLLASKKFDIQVVKRIGSTSHTASDVKVVAADFGDVESLRRAFTGQDAVVSVVGDAGVLSQKTMADAAIGAGVKRFIPSNFGSNMANLNSRKIPVFANKVAVEDYLVKKSEASTLTYSFVYVGALIDFTIQNKVIIDYADYAPTVYDDGNTEFSCTSMATVGDAVVGVLLNPEDTRNRAVYVSEVITTQNHLVELAKEIVPNKPWSPRYVSIDSVLEPALDRLSQGQHDLGTIIPVLLKTILSDGYGVKFSNNDNELLGIIVKGEDYLKQLITPMID